MRLHRTKPSTETLHTNSSFPARRAPALSESPET